MKANNVLLSISVILSVAALSLSVYSLKCHSDFENKLEKELKIHELKILHLHRNDKIIAERHAKIDSMKRSKEFHKSVNDYVEKNKDKFKSVGIDLEKIYSESNTSATASGQVSERSRILTESMLRTTLKRRMKANGADVKQE